MNSFRCKKDVDVDDFLKSWACFSASLLTLQAPLCAFSPQKWENNNVHKELKMIGGWDLKEQETLKMKYIVKSRLCWQNFFRSPGNFN